MGPLLRLGQPQALFATRARDSASDIPVFDASADGQRFLLNSRADGEPDPPLTVVVNWASGREALTDPGLRWIAAPAPHR